MIRSLVAINTATYAPSAAASDARSDDEGDASEHRPRREAPCDEAERRPTRARSDPRPARVRDRAPAPPAPAGLAGLCVTSYASARVWPASRRSRIYGHEYLGFAQKQIRILVRGTGTDSRGALFKTTRLLAPDYPPRHPLHHESDPNQGISKRFSD